MAGVLALWVSEGPLVVTLRKEGAWKRDDEALFAYVLAFGS